MNQPNAQTLTLFDLIARVWQAPAAIAGVRFAAEGGAAAFATENGAVMIASGADPEPPDTRLRVTGDLGQTTIRPRTKAAPPLVAVTSLADGAPPLATRGADFLAGDADGRVLRIGPDGATEPVMTLGGAILALDHQDGLTVAADRTTLAAGSRRLPLPGIRAIAARRGRIAAADARAIHLLAEGAHATAPVEGAERLSWRADGAWLGAALGGHGVALIDAEAPARISRLDGFPAPARDLVWSAPGAAFAAPGAFRIAAWDARPLPATDRPLVTGHPGLVAVEALAAHPVKPLIAAGYANGQVIIAEIGRRDELMIRQSGGRVTCLAFSPDGKHLAIGDADGAMAIATFPDRMFK